MLAGFTISIGVALISWNVLEKHMLKLKRFFEHEHTAKAHAATNIDLPLPATAPAAVPLATGGANGRATTASAV